ncbi:MAG: Fpg/Nei family DNA glycosylase [Corynebacterium sp.]|nr:Fpg/Nei family DNA glycosylase [Corynebacterium sp.]
MPEGDSVYQLSQRLQFLVGQQVTATSLRVPRYATVRFDGLTCQRVWPYGKHLFMEFGQEDTAPPGSCPQILHTHLKMEGVWQAYRTGERWRKPGYTARVVLEFDAVQVVGFSLGLVEVFPSRDYADRMSYLGPDLLGEWGETERATAIANIAARPERTIGQALLDQTNLAGIGNEYRAEMCFLLGVHPASLVRAVDVSAAVDLGRKLLWANRNEPIRSATGSHYRGETDYVFGRNHHPCRRCGTLIEKSELGEDSPERIIWWCPHCQPLLK